MTSATQLIIGAGPTGLHTAQLLAEAGHSVAIVSRSGGSATHPRIRRIALDASDAQALTRQAAGVRTIFNCSMPRYDRWPEEFPPIAAAVLHAAEHSGAALVTLSNLYGYGRVDAAMHEALPMAPCSIKGRVRAAMWEAARASRARVTEVRASDYLGQGAGSLFTLMTLPALLRGEPASHPGDLDAAHAWSFTKDVARTLVAAAASDASWGRAWHVPSSTASIRALADAIARQAGVAAPRLSALSPAELARLGEADSILREVVEMGYLYDRPCLVDSRATERALGVSATPLPEVLADLLRADQVTPAQVR